jgi:hypothetical protein
MSSGDASAKAEAIAALTNTPTEEFLAHRSEISTAGLTADEINAALAARPDLPRPLLPIERDVLLAILGYADFVGRDQLMEQVESTTVIGYCPCPCATVALQVSPIAARSIGGGYPIRNEAEVLDANGESIGGIIVFTEDGYLSALEIFAWDQAISPLPPLDRLQLVQRQY